MFYVHARPFRPARPGLTSVFEGISAFVEFYISLDAARVLQLGWGGATLQMEDRETGPAAEALMHTVIVHLTPNVQVYPEIKKNTW